MRPFMRYEVVEELADGRRRVRYVEGPLSGRTVVFHAPGGRSVRPRRPAVAARRAVDGRAEGRTGKPLISLLTEEQAADWEERRRFRVETEYGTVELGRLRAMPYWPNAVPGEFELCLVPQQLGDLPGDLPEDDVWTTLLLALETDARGFLAVANWRKRGGPWCIGPAPGLPLEPASLC